jgi:uncharacterized protein (TIGR03435 family)
MQNLALGAYLALALSLVSPRLSLVPRAVEGQSAPGTGPAFEVVSVKPSDPNPRGPAAPLVLPPVGGRFRATNAPLRLLVRTAYGLPDTRIVGGPSWQSSEKFDINAKIEDGFTGTMTDVLAMLKTLLTDRFKLRVHTEARELPVYALMIARSDGTLGPDMNPSTSNCASADTTLWAGTTTTVADARRLAEALTKGPAGIAATRPAPGNSCSVATDAGGGPANFAVRANGQPMTVLTQLLGEATGRVVIDETGLTGLYNWNLKLDPFLLRTAAQGNVPANRRSEGPSLFTSLQEQLGLKLESERAPVEVLVIDSAELPAPD